MVKQVANSDCSSISLEEKNSTDTSTAQSVVNTDYSDVHDETAIRACLVTTAFILLTFTFAALVALQRSRTIPKTACVLSSSLLFFDGVTMLSYAFRNILTDNFVLNILTMVGYSMGSASFINIAVMSLDRLILFQCPYFYLRRFTNGSYVAFYYIIIGGFLVSFTGQWLVCFTGTKSFWDIRHCMRPLITNYMMTSHIACVLLCIPCFVWIAALVIKQRRRERSRNEKSPTIVVFVCCLNYAFTTIVISVLILTTCQTSVIFKRTASELLYMINGLVDTCVYVLWFRECRYQLLKMMAFIFPPLRRGTANMRSEIFDVTGHNSVNSTNIAVI